MADDPPALVPFGDMHLDAALQHTHWRKEERLSSVADMLDAFLERSAFDRGPWLTVSFGTGIALWFVLADQIQWLAALTICAGAAAGTAFLGKSPERRVHLQLACICIPLLIAAGLTTVWAKSALDGAMPIDRPILASFDGKVLERIEQPAEGRVRLILATRDPQTGRAIKVRVNLPAEQDNPGIGEGALIRASMRLMPPAPPMLPGAYDFARAAWFQGFAATGSVQGKVAVLQPTSGEAGLAKIQRTLSAHVRSHLGGSAGTIAAAFASGDRGAIAPADEDAMRDAGLGVLRANQGALERLLAGLAARIRK